MQRITLSVDSKDFKPSIFHFPPLNYSWLKLFSLLLAAHDKPIIGGRYFRVAVSFGAPLFSGGTPLF